MTKRKKKLIIIQISFLILGVLIIFFTYLQKKQNENKNILSKETQKKIEINLEKNEKNTDVFYDVSYTGLDLSGNRYILKSKEARNDKTNSELVEMVNLNAFFYFKDGTILKINSDKGIYNNKTLDIIFEKNIKAEYQESVLFAELAEYSNSNNFLKISESVRIKDIRGEIFADNLFFDLKKQTLDIKSSMNSKINANLNLDEKKF
tara:strand:+ start:280 stop:897 length:618 start_codon:yes stop_codon:yes gene_type:complete